MKRAQMRLNMVGFYNLPASVLDSDDRLMELEKKVLRPYHPIYFEINAKVLIATFSDNIDEEALQRLATSIRTTLNAEMGDAGQTEQLYVRRPSPKELGVTPAGPGPGPVHAQEEAGFWGEFRRRSQLDAVVTPQDGDKKIRTRQAMQLIANLRAQKLKGIKFTDDGVKCNANKTRNQLCDALAAYSLHAAYSPMEHPFE